MTIRVLRGAALAALLLPLASCRMVSLPPASSRDDGGPVSALGTISHEARSHVRLYTDAAGCESVQTVNRRFQLVTVTGDTGEERLVLEEAYDVRQCLDTGAASSEATITAWRPVAGAPEPLFTIGARGMRGEPAGNLYQLTGHSCCGTGELRSYFSLLTGRALFASSGPLIQVHDSAAGHRYGAIHDSHSAGVPPESMADSTVVGVLQWGGDREPADRYAIAADRPEPFALAELALFRDGQPVGDSVGSAVPGRLELRFRLTAPGSGRSIAGRVPIAGAVLEPGDARLTGGARLRPLP